MKIKSIEFIAFFLLIICNQDIVKYLEILKYNENIKDFLKIYFTGCLFYFI